jgi:hypothetical protein
MGAMCLCGVAATSITMDQSQNSPQLYSSTLALERPPFPNPFPLLLTPTLASPKSRSFSSPQDRFQIKSMFVSVSFTTQEASSFPVVVPFQGFLTNSM